MIGVRVGDHREREPPAPWRARNGTTTLPAGVVPGRPGPGVDQDPVTAGVRISRGITLPDVEKM